MVFKIRTSQKTADIFNKMNASINYAAEKREAAARRGL